MIPKLDFSYNKKINPFISLRSEYLKKILGNKYYRKLIQILIDQKIIQCNEKYWYKLNEKGEIIDGECKKFRFHPKIYKSHVYNKIKFRRIKTKLNIKSKFIKKPKTAAERYLNSILLRTTIDLPEAEQYINNLDSFNKKEQASALVDSIKNKDFNCTRSVKVGRIYNEITTLPCDLRKFLRIDGEKLVEIDVKCCQPLLFQHFYDKKEHKKEYLKFKNLVEKHDFYDTMARDIYGKRDINRSSFKISFYKYIFGPKEYDSKYPNFFWFMYKNFPILLGLIDKEKKNSYANFARKMQNLESKIFIGNIVIQCKKLDIPILTVHDSVLVKEKDRDILQKMIIDTFQKMYDITPQLK